MGPNLCTFDTTCVASLTGVALPECTADTGIGRDLRLAKEVYQAEGSEEQSVPILFDKIARRIVNNESAKIIRMLNCWFGPLGSDVSDAARIDLYPEAYRHPELAGLRRSVNRRPGGAACGRADLARRR